MTLVKNCNPRTLGTFNNEAWNKWFNEFVNDPMWGGSTKGTHHKHVPAVNIVELTEDFRVDVAAPGLEKEDFKVELNNRILSVSADKKAEEEETTEKFNRKEFSYSSFKRSFKLPNIIDGDNIRAEYKSGILSIFLPKKEEAKEKPAREIEIK